MVAVVMVFGAGFSNLLCAAFVPLISIRILEIEII
jgi:hypothetical protein